MDHENTMIMMIYKSRPGKILACVKFEARRSAPPMSIEDSTIVDCRVRDLAVLATYSSKPDTSAIPLWEKTTAHQECGDGESSVYTSCVTTRSGTRRWSTGLSGSVDRFMFWRIPVRVDICRFGSRPRPAYVVW